jgi:hypothetical protein
MNSMKLFVLSLATLVGATAAHASGSEECFQLKVASLESVARELQVPKMICIDSINAAVENSKKSSPALVSFSGLGLESAFPATATGPVNERTITALAVDVEINEGTCSRTAAAQLYLIFKVNASGERISDVSFKGVVTDTSDNCHLNGDSAELEYVRI